MTQTVQVDTLTPELQISLNGAAGENGWYVSQTEVSAAATDSGSGLAALEVSLDGSAFADYLSPITLSDGLHTVQFRATDHAGNVTTTTQDVKVDTLTPNLNLFVNGKMGLNGWHISAAQVLASATDSGSGVGSIEATVNGGAWSIVHGPLSFSDGQHTYQARVKDLAGNLTQSPVQNVQVDTIAPFIDMPETLSLGERLYYSLQDDGSGLALYRAVIEDDAEKYKKVVWLDTLSGNKAEGDILWDAKFADGAKAKPGEYFITLKISDAAGNERMMTTVVDVTLLNSLLPLPAFEPPESAEPVTTPQIESAPSTFGGETVVPGEPSAPSIAASGGNRVEEKPVTSQTMSKAPVTSSFPIPSSAILWGAASAAAVGFFAAEAQRRKEEEERREREAAEAQQNALAQMFAYREPEPEPKTTPRKNKPLTPQERLQAIWDRNGAMIYEMNQQFKAKFGKEMDSETKKKAIKDATQNGVFQANQYAENLSAAKRQQEARNQAIAAKLARMEAEEERQEQARRAAEEARRNAQQKAMEDFRRGERDRTPIPVPTLVKEDKSWWGKAWNNILEPVVNFSVGVGYQIVRDNVDSLTIAGIGLFAPEKSSTLENYFQSWERFEENSAISDTFSFQAGKVVGGLLGIAQGIWEIGSGIATGTGGTVISCGTGFLCVAGGGASLAWGGALVAHGPMVLGASAVETGQALDDLFTNNHNQIRGNGGGSDPTLNYGSNKGYGRGGDNAKALRKNMEETMSTGKIQQVHDLKLQPHHIVPSTNQDPSAIAARKLLWEKFHIDINQAENGVFVTPTVNQKLNNPQYMDAVYRSLQNADDTSEAISILQSIANQILSTGTYP